MTVRQKQWQLFYLGFFNARDDIDGIWGAKSAAATKHFQTGIGITADGIFGKNTMAKSREIVAAIQAMIGVEEDGLAGVVTMAATREYQRSQDLPVTGIADAETRQRMGISEVPERMEPAEGDWWKEIRFFTREECKCKCGGRYCGGYPAEMRQAVLQVADRARAHFGSPAHVVSGLRCRQHNAASGGVANSQHMYGEAMDLRIDGISGEELLVYIRQQPEIRYAYQINSTNVHFDIPKGAR